MEINASNFSQETSSGVVLVKFGAVWCGPCKALNPILTELESEMPSVKFCHIDVDADGNMELAKQYGISGIPVMFFMKDGEIKDQWAGGHKKAKIQEILNGLLAE